MDEYVADPSLEEALSGLWSYFGLPPSRLSAFYYANQTGEYLKNGSFYIKPRSQALSQALAEVVEGAGGPIVYESVAEEILVADGAVTGVRLSDEAVSAFGPRVSWVRRDAEVPVAAQRTAMTSP